MRLHTVSKHTPSSSGAASSPKEKISSRLITLLLYSPLLLIFILHGSIFLLHATYHSYITVLIERYERGDTDNDGFYELYNNDVTYYNRQCGPDDISTTRSSDLILQPSTEGSKQQLASDLMMKHGALIFKDILSNQTAIHLREYLEHRHAIRESLPFHEKFFEEENRLALGLGAHDHPSIARALIEIGQHAFLQQSLEDILGPDPAVVEISTMTSMVGAGDQGIHTDSDYFGSALLYSRNFLHSHTMFVSLQDVASSTMGATTICPGSHYCANDDLEEVCLDSSFEVSSNGLEGDDGVLQRGDALLFNQNVWHRGSANKGSYGETGDLSRVMFIVSFASRAQRDRGDARQQALGTYYYQRWNMWGHTFGDLRHAATVMRQPWATLRSLGLWKFTSRQQKWGISWLEHFAQQLANGDHFYDVYELFPFIDYLDRELEIPKVLQGTCRYGDDDGDNEKDEEPNEPNNCEWQPFLEEMLDKWLILSRKIMGMLWCVYVTVWLFMCVISSILKLLVNGRKSITSHKQQGQENADVLASTDKNNSIYHHMKRLLWHHTCLCVLGYIVQQWIDSSIVIQRVISQQIHQTPFPDLPQNYYHDQLFSPGPTTLPERSDILIGTRFHAPWLGSYNHMLDYHPGNRLLASILNSHVVRELPNSFLTKHAVHETIFNEFRSQSALSGGQYTSNPRFLLQNPYDGHWSILSSSDALNAIENALFRQKHVLYAVLHDHLLERLADGRFGLRRDTAMSRQYSPLFVAKWDRVIGCSSSNDALKMNSSSTDGNCLDCHEGRHSWGVTHRRPTTASTIYSIETSTFHPCACALHLQKHSTATTAQNCRPNDKPIASNDKANFDSRPKSFWTRGAIPSAKLNIPISKGTNTRDGTSAIRMRKQAHRSPRKPELWSAVELRSGNVILVNPANSGRWLEANLVRVYDSLENCCLVQYRNAPFRYLYTHHLVSIHQVHLYHPLVEGNRVRVEFEGYTENWFDATLGAVHPLGRYDVYYDDGGIELDVNRNHIHIQATPRLYGSNEDDLEGAVSEFTLQPDADLVDMFWDYDYRVNDVIRADFRGRGEWFRGKIVAVNPEDFTFDVLYDDGGFEGHVEPQFMDYG